MLSLVDPRVLAQATDFPLRFREAKPFPHLVFEGFFTDEFCRRLAREFPPFEQGNALNEHGKLGGKSTYANIRELGPAYVEADRLFQSAEFLRLIAQMTGIPDLLYDAEYVGGGTHENRPGQELDPHVDFNYHPTTAWHRRLNLIVYLNEQWQSAWGGSIELCEDPRGRREQARVAVPPLFNHAVLFETSERSWHGFQAIRADATSESRKSLALYLYTKDRDTPAPRHSTVYVNRSMEDADSARKTSDQDDAAVAKRLVNRRAHHIKRLLKRDEEFVEEVRKHLARLADASEEFTGATREVFLAHERQQDRLLDLLYAREKEFSELFARIDKLTRQVHVAKLLSGPVELREYAGVWNDQWASARVVLEMRALGPVRSLTVTGKVPARLTSPQTLTASIGATEVVEVVQPGQPFSWHVPCVLSPGEDVRVELRAEKHFRPSAVGESKDGRSLAYWFGGVSAD